MRWSIDWSVIVYFRWSFAFGFWVFRAWSRWSFFINFWVFRTALYCRRSLDWRAFVFAFYFRRSFWFFISRRFGRVFEFLWVLLNVLVHGLFRSLICLVNICFGVVFSLFKVGFRFLVRRF